MRSAGIVLAAGASRRMGVPKQLLRVDGRPLLERVVAQACASSLDEVVVVLGANAERIRAEVDMGRARTVENPRHAEGMSTSLRAGIAALDGDVDRAVVILGDQPDVDAGVLDALLLLHERSGLPAAALGFDALLHPPMVISRPLWGELLETEGDAGFRRIVRARPERVAILPAQAPGAHPVDIDTPDDYERLVSATTAS